MRTSSLWSTKDLPASVTAPEKGLTLQLWTFSSMKTGLFVLLSVTTQLPGCLDKAP